MYRIILCCLVLALALNLQAQSPVIKNLVFEGAGMRGIAYCGALYELEDRKLMQHVEKVGGTSSGGLMALTISLGYTATEIQDVIGSTNFKKLNDGRLFFPGGINRMSKRHGWYRGEKLSKWIGTIIRKKTGNADITFEQLVQQGYKPLYVTATCLNKQELVILSHETYPKMKVRDAVRISMGIPLYFVPVLIDKDGNVIRKAKKNNMVDVMVDGGFTGNFPIRVFDSMGLANNSTIGFRIDNEAQILSDTADHKLVAQPISNFNEYILALYTMVIENLNRQSLTDADWQRTISICDGDVSPRIRRLSKEEINILIDNGRKAMKSYLN